MAKVISIHDAKIRTVNVGIRAITISDKQVTLAVFRQILEEPLIDYWAGRLNGVPWGYVNIHDKFCSDQPPHRHYVWQLGDELRRAVEGTEPIPDSRECRSRAIDAWVTAEKQASGKHFPHYGKLDGLPYEFGHTVNLPGIVDAAMVASLKSYAQRAIAAEKARREAYRRLLLELESMPQLFVAV